VTLLYEGYQIFFGTIQEAKHYFTSMGFVCPDNQTTPGFLLSMTSPAQRVLRPGVTTQVPRTPFEFSLAWQKSMPRIGLICEINKYDDEYPVREKCTRRFTELFLRHENGIR
jgi:ATP-binding cassette, subfamily G (WHITE), member 2, PDR